MGETIENGEFLLRQHDDIQQSIDFTTRDTTATTIADDLAFIMRTTDLLETSNEIETRTIHIKNSDSEDSSDGDDDGDSSDSSVVKVLEVVRPTRKDTICISSSSGSSTDEEMDKQAKSLPKISPATRTKATEKSLEKVCGNVLRRMVWKVDSIVRGEIISDSKFDSSSDEEEEVLDSEVDRRNLQAIIEDELRIVNSIPKVPNEVLPEEIEIDEEVVELKDDDTLVAMGVISGVVEKMIVIKANKDAPALDADSALFGEDGKFLGKVFDTFGPVKTPFYSVQLSKNVDPTKLINGSKVNFVPFNQEMTKYIFLEQLKKLKGSDASWMNDCEPPQQHLDYSDDEEERRVKKDRKRHLNKSIDDKTPNDTEIEERQPPPPTRNKKEPSKNQRRLQKKRIIDLTTHGKNPLLEHAKLMNDSVATKRNALTNLQSTMTNQHDIPLSEFLNGDSFTSQNVPESTPNLHFEYVSPLHQTNPNQNREKQQIKGSVGNRVQQNNPACNTQDNQQPPMHHNQNRHHHQHQGRQQPPSSATNYQCAPPPSVPQYQYPAHEQSHQQYGQQTSHFFQGPSNHPHPLSSNSSYQPHQWRGPSNPSYTTQEPSFQHGQIHRQPQLYGPPTQQPYNRAPHGAPYTSQHGLPPPSHGPPPPPHGPPPPPHGAPPPSHGQPPPTHGALPPSHGQPPPSHGAPMPLHGAPPPSHGAPSPSHGAPSPSHGQHLSSFGPSNQQHAPPNQSPHGAPNQHQHMPPNQYQHGPPNQPSYGPPSQHQHGPPHQPQHGPPNQYQHGPPNRPPHGLPNQQQHQPFDATAPNNNESNSQLPKNAYYNSFLEMSYKTKPRNNQPDYSKSYSEAKTDGYLSPHSHDEYKGNYTPTGHNIHHPSNNPAAFTRPNTGPNYTSDCNQNQQRDNMGNIQYQHSPYQ